MKIILNTENNEIFNVFRETLKNTEHQILNIKSEPVFFDAIENNNVDAYILWNNISFFKKAVEFIKKRNPYVPIIGVINMEVTFNVPVDIYINEPMSFEGTSAYHVFTKVVLYNINMYSKAFSTLKKLTSKMHEKIEFGLCVYDPTRRILYHKGKEIKKLSQKEGGIVEILASNYREVVKKEVILEKVWHKLDYFAGRSMDVYITYLRNTFKNNKIKMTIKNISGVGLILE